MKPDITVLSNDWLQSLLKTAKEYPDFVAFTAEEIEAELDKRQNETRHPGHNYPCNIKSPHPPA